MCLNRCLPFHFSSDHVPQAKRHSLDYRRVEARCSLTYGEIPLTSLRRVLDEIRRLPGGSAALQGTFLDLGSGCGKVTLGAALLGRFSSVGGIELVPELHQMALGIKREWVVEHWQPQVAMWFEVGDFVELDWRNPDVVIVHCTCFSERMMVLLSDKAASLSEGSFVVTTTLPLPCGAHFQHCAHVSAEVPYHVYVSCRIRQMKANTSQQLVHCKLLCGKKSSRLMA